MTSQGLIQVYTGPGKGKSTAATGLALRALGHGHRVLLVRFLKPVTPESGEITILRQLAGIEILDAGIGGLSHAPAAELVAVSVQETFAAAFQRIAGGGIDLAIFDELNNALHRGELPLAAVLDLCATRPGGTELVFTGRHAPPELLERADLVTVMEAYRHPLQRGIPARQGIEY